ncbi:MAG: Na+/H+ antiporter NhaC family protein [Synergistaceae bacterium]|nr:Na+/H+ antiporter NhaC family protein [Synergistaceae bacterium]MBQ3654898.1 Na+/H+ antiporter NhaC family protein [Synergistaceae bacterium]
MTALIKLSPVIVLGLLMNGTVGLGLDILLAAPLSLVYALIIGMIFGHVRFNDLMDAAVESMKHIVLVFLILQMAYAVATCFMETGVAASIINMALSLGLTAKLVAMTSLLVTAILSIATGTSWGTFAACAPIFLWLNHIVGGSNVLTIAAIAGGSCFGDNIGLISDTTVVSSSLQGVQITDRIRHQGVWSFLCLVAGAAAFYFAAVNMGLPDTVGNANDAIAQVPQAVWDALQEKRPAAVTLLNQVKTGVPYYMVIPLIAVLVLAGAGVNTLVCLGTGILGSLVCGYFAGTVTSVSKFLEMVQSSFADAGSWVIVMMLWIAAFGGVMRRMDAFGAIARLILSCVRSVKQLMFANGLLCLVGNAALADEMAQIVTISPIIKDLTERNVKGSEKAMYKLALRNATFSDAMGVFGSQLIPWHVYLAFFAGITYAVYPMAEGMISLTDIILHNYLAWIAVLSMLLLTLTGLDRFIPLFGLPREPEVQLVKE